VALAAQGLDERLLRAKLTLPLTSQQTWNSPDNFINSFPKPRIWCINESRRRKRGERFLRTTSIHELVSADFPGGIDG